MKITFKPLNLALFLLLLLTQAACSKKDGVQSLDALLYTDGMPIHIEFVDGRISKIRNIPPGADQPELYVAPGLIDIQINGYMGVDFADQNLNIEMIREATRALWKEGVTTYLPTLITADSASLTHSFSVLKNAMEDEVVGKSIPGFHLEGPYISPEKGFRGAHLEKYIRKANWEEFQSFQTAAGGGIRLITVAPEIEGAIPFIEKCRESGVVVSLGHHDGNADDIAEAADAGATLSTHLGNGCANLINRHNNPLWPQLAEDRLNVSLIADGYHLREEEVRTFYKVKGTDKTILVSDALDLAGLEPGEYVRWERKVLLTPHVVKFPAENVLAGAASPISACVMNMMRFTGCSLADAIQMAAGNPARLLGIEDLGEIDIGKKANLILFSKEGGKMVIHKTIVNGETVYSEN